MQAQPAFPQGLAPPAIPPRARSRPVPTRKNSSNSLALEKTGDPVERRTSDTGEQRGRVDRVGSVPSGSDGIGSIGIAMEDTAIREQSSSSSFLQPKHHDPSQNPPDFLSIIDTPRPLTDGFDPIPFEDPDTSNTLTPQPPQAPSFPGLDESKGFYDTDTSSHREDERYSLGRRTEGSPRRTARRVGTPIIPERTTSRPSLDQNPSDQDPHDPLSAPPVPPLTTSEGSGRPSSNLTNLPGGSHSSSTTSSSFPSPITTPQESPPFAFHPPNPNHPLVQISSSSSSSIFKRPRGSLPGGAGSSWSVHSQSSSQPGGSRKTSAPPSFTPSQPSVNPSGYVNARKAREEERRLELEQKRETEKNAGIVVKDGYKIVDGVEKKRSTSGVYTPATFPGATAKSRTVSAGMYTPHNPPPQGSSSPRTPETRYPFLSSPPLPSPTPSPYFGSYGSHGGNNPSPGRESPGWNGEERSGLGKKRSFVGNLISPGLNGMRSMTDGWRRSSADSTLTSTQGMGMGVGVGDPVSPRKTRTGSAGLGMGIGLQASAMGYTLEPPEMVRMRSVSDQAPYSTQQGFGMADGRLERGGSFSSGIVNPSQQSSPGFETVSVPPPQPQTQTRPRNVKGLTLPLMDLHGVAEQADALSLKDSLPNDQVTLGTGDVLGIVAKGVRRKPVPQS